MKELKIQGTGCLTVMKMLNPFLVTGKNVKKN